MIRKRRFSPRAQSGFYQFGSDNRRHASGFGDGEYIRLRDDRGNIWRGLAEVQDDNTVHYRFRDSNGRSISGVADGFGILLRDDRGTVWRGYVY